MNQRYFVIVEKPNPKSEHGRDDWEVWDTTQEPAGSDFIQPFDAKYSYDEIAEGMKNYLEGVAYKVETREENEQRLAELYKDERDFSLEIERDHSKAIALPPREVVDLRAVLSQHRNDPHADRIAAAKEKNAGLTESDSPEREDEKKPQPDQSETSKNADLETNRTTQSAEVTADDEERDPDRTFPDDIQRRFYIRADHRGDQHVFADSHGKREVFQDAGEKLRTKINDAHAVKLMLDTAAHRGWSSINVKGSAEFKREAWLEGQARGIVVNGYKPTELDMQELKNREQAYLRNEISQGDDRPITQTTARQDERLDASEPQTTRVSTIEDRGLPASPDPSHETSGAPKGRSSSDYQNGIEGVLVEKGTRPYKDNEKNDPSPYIVLQDKQGQHHTAWGVGLPDAILKSGAREGDYLCVREAGMETVVKNVLQEIDGRMVRVPKEVERRAWEAEVLQEQTFEKQKDALNINDVRAKDFIASGRGAARQHPELKAAASLDAYVERKVRQHFPDNPAVVQRAMQTARTKIGDAVARGEAIPEPRVIELREHSRSDQTGSEQGKAPELNMERNRQQERSR